MSVHTDEELLEEKWALQAQLADREEALRRLRRREEHLLQLIEQDSGLVVEVTFRNGELRLRALGAADSGPSDLDALFAGGRVQERLQRAFIRGAPVVLDVREPASSKQWRIRVVPLSSEEEMPRRALATLRRMAGSTLRPPAVVGETRELYLKLIELLPDAIVIISTDGRVRFINSAGMHLLGAPDADAIQGTSFWAFVPPEDRWGMEVRMGRLRRGESIDFVGHTVRRMDGEEVPVETASTPITYRGRPAVLSAVRDLRSRKRMERAARRHRDLFQMIFHASPTPITIARLEDGEFIDVNDEFCRLTGYDHEALVGHTAEEMGLWIQPEERRELVRYMNEEGAVHDFEMEIRTRTGETRELMASFQRITADGVDCLLGVENDITARKHAEEALREAKERAEEIAQFRTGILTNMTHEVRTPLTVILGFTSILREGVRIEYERFVDLIERSGRRLLLTLDSVLDLAQLQAGTLEVTAGPFNVVEVVHRALGPLQPFADDKDIALEVETAQAFVYAHIDHELLARVLNHLIDNAIKFTEKGAVTVRVRSGAEYVYVDVEDTGIGMEEVFIPQLFDPFSQESTGLDRSYQGSGLGLTVAKQLVERFGGRIEVTSQKDEGSVFTVVLSRAEIDGTA